MSNYVIEKPKSLRGRLAKFFKEFELITIDTGLDVRRGLYFLVGAIPIEIKGNDKFLIYIDLTRHNFELELFYLKLIDVCWTKNKY